MNFSLSLPGRMQIYTIHQGLACAFLYKLLTLSCICCVILNKTLSLNCHKHRTPLQCLLHGRRQRREHGKHSGHCPAHSGRKHAHVHRRTHGISSYFCSVIDSRKLESYKNVRKKSRRILYPETPTYTILLLVIFKVLLILKNQPNLDGSEEHMYCIMTPRGPSLRRMLRYGHTHVRHLLFSHSVMASSLQPHELQPARPACPSLSPRAGLNSCPLVMPSSHLILGRPFFSCLQSFLATGSFRNSESALCIKWLKVLELQHPCFQ